MTRVARAASDVPIAAPNMRTACASSLSKRLSPQLAGTSCCIASAVCYTVSNICMRQLAVLSCDPTWAACGRESVTVALVAPWLALGWLRGRGVRAPWRSMGLVAAVGLAVQVIGNQCNQWAMGIVGLAVNIPAIYGTMLVASVVLGGLLLGERATPRGLAAVGLVLLALIFLGISAARLDPAASPAAGLSSNVLVIFLAILGAMSAGTVYTLLSVTIRVTVTDSVPAVLLLLIVPLMGTLSLGPLSAARLGPAALGATSPGVVGWMAAAGLMNGVAFLAIIKGLQLKPVVHASVLSASQVAMAALAGMWLFHEPGGVWLFLGVGLTIAGILAMDRPQIEAP